MRIRTERPSKSTERSVAFSRSRTIVGTGTPAAANFSSMAVSRSTSTSGSVATRSTRDSPPLARRPIETRRLTQPQVVEVWCEPWSADQTIHQISTPARQGSAARPAHDANLSKLPMALG